MSAFEELFGPSTASNEIRVDVAAPKLQLELTPPPSAAAAAAPAPSSMRFEFFVAGEPKPKGSKRAFVIPGTNRAIVTDKPTAKGGEQRLKAWNTAVTDAAREALGVHERITVPCTVAMTFYLARPAGHFGAKGVKGSAPRHHGTKPDPDKLSRSTLDALKVGMLVDDSRVWDLHVIKRFVGDHGIRETGCRIVVEVTP